MQGFNPFSLLWLYGFLKLWISQGLQSNILEASLSADLIIKYVIFHPKSHYNSVCTPFWLKKKWNAENSSTTPISTCMFVCTVSTYCCVYTCVSVLLYMVTCVRLCMSLQVFSNCSCVGVAGNFTASTGQCPHKDDCDSVFPYFLALSVITSFIISLGGTPGYMLLIRSDLSQKKQQHLYTMWFHHHIPLVHFGISNHFTIDLLMQV